MAARKPLVLNNGEIQQLQAGDTLAATVTEVGVITLTNGDVGAHVIGNVVYISANDTVKLAEANAIGTKDAMALCASVSVGAGTTGSYQTDGDLPGLSGLVAGSVYYLSPSTPGGMSTTPPSTAGQYVVRLGIAISTTEFLIHIERAILL